MKGRKRHIAVDSQGWVVAVLVHPANWADSAGARHLLKQVPLYARWQKVLFDGGYDSPALLHWCRSLFGILAPFAPFSVVFIDWLSMMAALAFRVASFRLAEAPHQHPIDPFPRPVA